jgi:hypothetical protein
MKIEINRKKMKFADLYNGACFITNNYEQSCFLKLNDDEINNAVSLRDAELWAFEGDEVVNPVNAKVVIE